MENFSLNIELFRLINSHHTALLDAFFAYYRYLGTGWVLIPAIFLTWRLRSQKLSGLMLAVAIETIIVLILKDFLPNPRPGALLENVHLLQNYYKHSFPSGDTALAFAIAVCLMRGERRWVQIALVGYALIVAYERIYIGVHFPLDVTAGAVIGIASGYAAPFVIRLKRRQKE